MKKFRYETAKPEGVLVLMVPHVFEDEQIKYECDCAYSAWLDTDENDDNFLEMEDYVAHCLIDSGIAVVLYEFQEASDEKRI